MSNVQRPMSNGMDRRRGVALIVVLGFLSIMVMMAVAFLTQARVERLVAGAALEGMRTRQMAQSAIAAGMQDYLNALKKMQSQADTEHDVFLSGDGGGTLAYYYSGLTIDDDRLALGKVEDWLLNRHLKAALGGGGDAVRNAEWLWVRESPGQRSRILGRYAYACFDMSGQIDVNLLGTGFGDTIPSTYEYGGDPTNRNNVRKMLFDAVRKTPENGNARQSLLNKHQRIWKGFDTPAALLNLTDGKWNDGRNSGANRWLGSDMNEEPTMDVADLACYSYSATHLGSEAGGNLKVPCDAASIEKWGGNDFDSLLNETSKQQILNALQDYESPQSLEPRGIDYPSVKNVPMFNEIGIRVGLRETPGGVDGAGNPASSYHMVVYLKTEFWYPFPSRDNARNDSFNFRPVIGGDRNQNGTFLDGTKAEIWVQMAGLSTSNTAIELRAELVGDLVSVGATFGDPYLNDGGEQEFEVPLTLMDGTTALPPGMRLRVGHIQINKDAPLILRQGSVQVDSTPNDVDIPGLLEYLFRPAAVLAHNETTAEQPSWEVSDPRLNHRKSAWDSTGPTWSGVNNATTAARQKAKAATGIEPGEYMYCRNGPMHSPAELGYIPTVAPWETLDVFSDRGTWLMNRLVSDPEVYGMLKSYKVFFTNGTINPFTRNTNVLNAAFYGVSLAEVPNMRTDVGGGDKHLSSASELTQLVSTMIEEEAKKGPAGWSTILNQNGLNPDWNKNNRIALVNNTWGLFDESDRLFVVAVVAQSIKEGEGKTGVGNWDDKEDMVTGERRAVALCWMDSSSEGSADTLAQELNIIAFQYLNE